MKKVVIDIYGADRGEGVILRGAVAAMKEDSELFCVFAGDGATVRSEMEKAGVGEERYSVLHTNIFVENTDNPANIVKGREKENSSMGLALDALREDGETVGLLSAGSTGALLVGSIFRLGLVKGLKMPALSSNLPVIENGKFVCLVDCGANIDCKAKSLIEFALLGNAYAKCMYKLEEPRVALMSVGREEGKGNAVLKEAYGMMKELPLNFVGNLEGNDLFSGDADVIVCDGYAGNLLLKNSEAVGKYAYEVSRSLCEKYGVSEELLEELKAQFSYRFDFNSNGGATFLGTKKTVIKMHGSANEHTVKACIGQMNLLHSRGFDSEIAKALEN